MRIASRKICRSATNFPAPDPSPRRQTPFYLCELPTPPPPANAANGWSQPPKASGCAAPNFTATRPTPWTTAGNTPIATAAVKKRTFRYLWQVRINAAARAAGITYSRFIEGLKAAKCALDRKVLADIAAQDNAAFGELVKIAKNALAAKGVKG